MGDIANMMDCDGRVNGHRLLRWLRSRELLEQGRASTPLAPGMWAVSREAAARADLLREMADDLERELTPPDYPEDDGDEPERRCPNCRGRGTVALEPDNPRTLYWPCQACKGTGKDCTVDSDTVDLDGLAPTGGPEESQPEGPAYRDFAPGREDDPEAYREMVQQERAEEEAGLSIRRRKQE